MKRGIDKVYTISDLTSPDSSQKESPDTYSANIFYAGEGNIQLRYSIRNESLQFLTTKDIIDNISTEDQFITILKKSLIQKFKENVDTFLKAANTLIQIGYPGAQPFKDTLIVQKNKYDNIDIQHCKHYKEINELFIIKDELESCIFQVANPPPYIEEKLKTIQKEIHAFLLDWGFSDCIEFFTCLKESFAQNIVDPLNHNPALLEHVNSDLLAYVHCVYQQLINLSSIVSNLLRSANAMPLFYDNDENQTLSWYEQCKSSISGYIGKGIKALVSSKLENSTFSTLKFLETFTILDQRVRETSFKELSFPDNPTDNSLPKTIVNHISQTNERFNVQNIINCGWQTLKINETGSSDLLNFQILTDSFQKAIETQNIPSIDPVRARLAFVNKILEFCYKLHNIIHLIDNRNKISFFNSLKLWQSTQPSASLGTLVFKEIYAKLQQVINDVNKSCANSLALLKCSIFVQMIMKSIDNSKMAEALYNPYINKIQDSEKLDAMAQLGFIVMIDPQIALFDIFVEKLSREIAKRPFVDEVKALSLVGFTPKSDVKASGGKQKKANGTGFYQFNNESYYLKHVAYRDFVADDLVEVIVTDIANALNFQNRIAQCGHIKSATNTVFLASKCVNAFTPLLDTGKRLTSRLTPVERKQFFQSLSPADIQQLADILALSLYWGDYDPNPGNIGRSQDGLIKIDHGWALENLCANKPINVFHELDPLRYLDRMAPTNCFNDYPDIIHSEQFLISIDSIIVNSKYTNLFDIIFSSIDRMINTYTGSKAAAGLDKSIFTMFGWDEKVLNLSGDGIYSKDEIIQSLSKRLGIKQEVSLHQLVENIAWALHFRIHVIKLIVLVRLLQKSQWADKDIINNNISLSVEECISLCDNDNNKLHYLTPVEIHPYFDEHLSLENVITENQSTQPVGLMEVEVKAKSGLFFTQKSTAYKSTPLKCVNQSQNPRQLPQFGNL